MRDFKLFINGQGVAGAGTMPILNPATEEVLAECPRADAAQLEEAVSAAKAAFPAWAATDIADRRAKLLAIFEEIEANADELARLLTSEQGKPLPHAQGEVAGAIYMARAMAVIDLPEKVLDQDDGGQVVEHRTPLGVVAAITPWNFPVALITVKAISALLAGNTMVAKPAPTTPLTTLFMAEIYNRHLPAGVFNVIVDQNDLGATLSAHPDVAKISFTGSTATGSKVLASAAGLIKRVTLELGGNDAAIVLDDVEPKAAARSLFDGAMVNSGQVCLAIKRAYVHDRQYDAVCDELAVLAEEAIVEDGSKQGAQFGPIQNKQQYEKVLEIIETARSDGKIIAGGVTPDRPGYFIRPTIVRDIPDDARLVREEQFGPVLPVLRYSDLDDAIARANDTDFGLGGTVWSSDIKRGLEVAKRIDAGMVWVNQHMNVNPLVTTGGAKQSGLGSELGAEGVHEFTQRHIIYVPKAA